MITFEQANSYMKGWFDEADSLDRIVELPFAFRVNTQPRVEIDAQSPSQTVLSHGPLFILKDSGEVYLFSSSPTDNIINTAATAEEFKTALLQIITDGDKPPILVTTFQPAPPVQNITQPAQAQPGQFVSPVQPVQPGQSVAPVVPPTPVAQPPAEMPQSVDIKL